MLARKVAKLAGSIRTKTASRKIAGGKKATNHRTEAKAAAAARQKNFEKELDALLTVILDDVDARLAAGNAVLDRIAAA